jgi:serine/threonine-protein kinase
LSDTNSEPLFTPECWLQLRELLARFDTLTPDAHADELARVEKEDPQLARAARDLLGKSASAGAHSIEQRINVMIERADGDVPTQVGPFRLLDRLGAGGMGVVYLAERKATDFTQRVALKLLDRGSSASAHLAARERRILAALVHPNITAFVDAGVEDGRALLAME